MNLSFRLVLEKSVLLDFMQPAGHAPVTRPYPTRPDQQLVPVDPTGFHLWVSLYLQTKVPVQLIT